MSRPLAVAVTLAAALLSSPAPAQVSTLDRATLADELAREGMSDLLLHLVETEPSDDPVSDRLTRIAQLRLQSRDAALPLPQRSAALEQAMQGLRDLIAEHPDHHHRPMWQTDLAEMLLVDRLAAQQRQADVFALLGVATTQQRQAVKAAAAEALQLTSDADRRFFELQGILPRQIDHEEKRVKTGLWDRMMRDYWMKRTRFLRGEAALLSAADAGPQERSELLEVAVEALQPLATDTDARPLRQLSAAWLGLAMVGQNDADAALRQLETHIAEEPDATAADLYVRLVQARALAAAGRPVDAVSLIQRLQNHEQVRAALLSRLLVSDVLHRLLLDRAAQAVPADRSRATVQAYEPYTDLLRDPALTGQAEAIEAFLAQRWADAADGAMAITDLPPTLQTAVGRHLRLEGQRLAMAAGSDDAQTEQAREILQRAVATNERIASTSTDAGAVTSARYNAGLARYWLDPQDAANAVAVGRALVDAAAASPQESAAEHAIAAGVALLRQAAATDPPVPGAQQAYRDAGEVLFHRFALSRVADDERLYYAAAVLSPAGEDRAALALLADIPADHSTWADAQQHRMAVLARLVSLAPADDREALTIQLQRIASDFRRAAQRSGNVEHAALATIGLAQAARLAGEPAHAIALLDALPADLSRGVQVQAMQTRIATLVGSDHLTEAAAAAQLLMHQQPDIGAATLNLVLADLEQRIARLRQDAALKLAAADRQPLEAQAAELADSAAQLAALLLDWARKHSDDPQTIAALELAYGRSLRQAGRLDEAVAALNALHEALPDNAEVLAELARALQSRGDADSLNRAAALYDRLIAGYQRPYPDAWWDAWVKRLQIMRALGQDDRDVTLRVRQLRLVDPQLGGPPHQRELENLVVPR